MPWAFAMWPNFWQSKNNIQSIKSICILVLLFDCLFSFIFPFLFIIIFLGSCMTFLWAGGFWHLKILIYIFGYIPIARKQTGCCWFAFFAAGISSVHFQFFCDPIGDDETWSKAPELACCCCCCYWASLIIQSKPEFLHHCKFFVKLK